MFHKHNDATRHISSNSLTAMAARYGIVHAVFIENSTIVLKGNETSCSILIAIYLFSQTSMLLYC